MECVSSFRQTRCVFLVISFGSILLWIMFGSYTRPDYSTMNPAVMEAELVARQSGGMRHMLSISPEFVRLSRDDKCEMYYETGSRVQIDNDECSDLHNLDFNVSRCNYVNCVESCKSESDFNYLKFIYCVLPSKLVPLGMIILFLWLIFLFIFLGATAEEYFCPALTVISSVLRLSQNVAGVTLLALGNGAPDIFSSYAAINQDEDKKASLAIGALFGAGIFVTTIVVGGVTVTRPFTLTQRPFLRDIIFYIAAVFWTFYLLWTHSMTIYHAVGFVILYVFYVIVVIVGRVIYQHWKKWRKNNRLGTGDMPRAPASPEGKEMNNSKSTKATSSAGGLRVLGSLFPGVGLSGSHTQNPVIANGRIDVQREEKDEDITSDVDVPRIKFCITSVGSSEHSSSEHVEKPVIRVQDNDDSDEEAPLYLSKNSILEKRRQKELMGASLPPLVPQALLGLSSQSQRLRGSSAGPSRGRTGYGSFAVTIQDDSSRSPSPTRKPLRKTISGALDVTEGVGAVFGIPHVPELWEEVNRSHSRSRTSGNVSRHSRSHSKSPLIEEASDDDDRTPLIRSAIPSMNISSGGKVEGDRYSESEGEEDVSPAITLTTPKKRHPFIKLLQGLWPFGESFRELGIIGKIYEIVKSPAGLLLCLTVPVIDTNEELNNWNKWLSVLHCVTAPVFISLMTKFGLINLGGVFPVWTLILIVGLMLAILVACTSKDDNPPIYHCVFAWVGFAVAVVWIYTIANEIVNLLQAFGVVIRISDGILGLTLLAWGNSIGDAVSNLTMAKQGFPRMAIGACFGGPLLNMLLGIGIASVVKTIKKSSDGFKFRLYFTQVELIAALFLISSLVCTLVTVFLLKFRLRRIYGIFLMIIYVLFLTLAILAESKQIMISISGVIDAQNDG